MPQKMMGIDPNTDCSCALLPEPDAAASIHLDMTVEKSLLQGKALLCDVSTHSRNQVLEHDQVGWHAVLRCGIPSAL